MEIAQLPISKVEQDTVWRTPKETMDQQPFLDKAPKVILWAQLTFGEYSTLTPVATGSDEDTSGYLIIRERDQERNKFKPNDFLTRVFPRGRTPVVLNLRIFRVRPAAQRENFGLYRLEFGDDARG